MQGVPDGAEHTERYSSVAYWDSRYARLARLYEWYGHDFADLVGVSGPLAALAARTRRPLELGCGTSSVGPAWTALHDVGVVAVDFSRVAIATMQAIGHAGVEFVCAAAESLPFADGSFDVIFEKGTFDAIFSEIGVDRQVRSKAALSECHRVLEDDGHLISVSHSSLVNRRAILEQYFELVHEQCLENEHTFLTEKTYLYIFKRRRTPLQDICDQNNQQNNDSDIPDKDPFAQARSLFSNLLFDPTSS